MLTERAAKRVETILAEHKPELLPHDVTQMIRTIVQQAETK